MEKNILFTCDGCGHDWKRFDYPEAEEGSEERGEFGEGYSCPKCGSKDIGGEDL